jgi:hypothetical protein
LRSYKNNNVIDKVSVSESLEYGEGVFLSIEFPEGNIDKSPSPVYGSYVDINIRRFHKLLKYFNPQRNLLDKLFTLENLLYYILNIGQYKDSRVPNNYKKLFNYY